MRTQSLLACLLALLVVPAVAEENPQAKIESAVAEAIRLLEAREHKTFLQKFIEPDALAKMREETEERGEDALDHLLKQFVPVKSETLLKALKSIKDATPSYENDGNKAVFKLEEGPYTKGHISFRRVDGLWYLEN